ncbi:DUF4159 domain-containing protein [Pararhizobium mangrovi]|uniref:DUF4159 domain-containing protein n=1 Tax=Pararhizobium mangrovi TaxID=2590452 RepID=A0A506UHS4_9HYPH|nr:DUF4159 domain-containing protein [Pararhizobium mangrovi]TPW32867.1 DUF4159 domain-containing protein [Pararhizobium mangrovi]
MLPLAFGAPAVLFGLLALPVIWWLLRLTPPRPRSEVFPPLRILAAVLKKEETPAQSPWWLTVLRIVMAALVILALADPVLDPTSGTVSSRGPLALVVDNSWSTAPDWQRRVAAADRLIDQAADTDVPVSLTFTASRDNDPTPTSAANARERLRAARPQPIPPARERAAARFTEAFSGTAPGTLAFIADGIASNGGEQAFSRMIATGPADIRLIEGDGNPVAITDADNGADRFTVSATRLDTDGAENLGLDAYDAKGRSIATGRLHFDAGSATGSGAIDVPFELRNDFARIGIASVASAGASYLLDDSDRRRRVALVSGAPSDNAQELLSPLHYIEQALQPYADLLKPEDSDLAQAIPNLLKRNPSVIVMADIGTLPEDVYPALEKWIRNGGTLLRFAGPRLAGTTAKDPLVPVQLRAGERALGGTMSWSEPQHLAAFSGSGPFAGIQAPQNVTVSRQVLAQPSPDLEERTWASLADGTPLVTAKTEGEGRIVLFHVTATPTWSNLPLSGAFVEMLRKTIALSKASPTGGTDNGSGVDAGAPQSLPPYRLLSAEGILVEPSGDARPVTLRKGALPRPTLDNPPGLYGTQDGFRALNLMRAGDTLEPLAMPEAADITRTPLVDTAARALKPWLFALAMLLLLVDSVIVLVMGGALSTARLARAGRSTGAALLLACLGAGLCGLGAPRPAFAQEDTGSDASTILDKIDTTHLAYVVTGDEAVDRISRAGLEGLSRFLTNHTALEPGPPDGVHIDSDPLAFYPLIYWPMAPDAAMPSDAAVGRIDAYMKNGGTVLFDTRDQLGSLGGDGAVTPQTQRLRAILANLDVPPLEPVPDDDVLTKAFYILRSFPGRYAGGRMWVEATPDDEGRADRPVRAGDGVSSIVITGNDLAGAWAVNGDGSPLLPTVPNDPRQRELAYRVGVNLVMYTLTGNYKADQVHIPALLERLGQ